MAGQWTQLTVKVKTTDTDRAADILGMLECGVMIEDYSDFSLNGMYGELVDDAILSADREHSKISIFVPEERNVYEYTAFVEARLSSLGVAYELSLAGMSEDDWAESWKKYFKPIRLGRVTIVPAWEDYEAAEGETLVRIDPGMAFGTGTHETTRLVMKIMQDLDLKEKTVLDVGCGSGILSICASELGASVCNAYDIDPVAVKVARDNAKDYPGISVDVSDLLSDVKVVPGGYGLCVANIVADIILRMLPDIGSYLHPSAPVILSGIIAEREAEIVSAAKALGWSLVRRESENDWVALMIKRS
jgi:ribosomal protein L11 methyltransferase